MNDQSSIDQRVVKIFKFCLLSIKSWTCNLERLIKHYKHCQDYGVMEFINLKPNIYNIPCNQHQYGIWKDTRALIVFYYIPCLL